MKKIHSEKIINIESLFRFMDNNNNNIAKVIDYNSENNPNKIYKLVLIGNADMYNNLKDNQINQFFFDCTYKLVLPNKHRFRLMVLCGYN